MDTEIGVSNVSNDSSVSNVSNVSRRNSEETKLNFLVIDPRAYKFIREQTMQNIADAFVELLTNCIDAYKQSSNTIYDIKITVDIVQRTICVVDQAIGLTAEGMAKCFLQVGGLTAAVNSRGYFSRGAKDICALGDVTISAIKDGLLSKCFINTLGMGGILIENSPVTEEERAELQIINNGLNFFVKLKKSVELVPERIPTIIYHYALRDIFSDNKNKVTIKILNDGILVNTIPLTYRYPTAQKVIDMEFQVPGYNVPAKFTLYKSKVPIQSQYDVIDDKYMNFGILIATSTTIHMNTTLYPQIRYHPYISYLYGRLQCDYLTDLVKQLDLTPDQYDTVLNPFSVIDPNRISGLNRTHPFTKALYKIPYERLQFVLEQLENEHNVGNDINYSAINDIFNNLDLDLDLSYYEIIKNPDKVTLTQKLYESIISQNIVHEDPTLEYSKENIDLVYSSKKNDRPLKPKLRIKLTKIFLKYDYVYYKTKEGYCIEISTTSSLLKNYVSYDENDKPIGLNHKEAIIHLCYLIKEAITRILVSKHFLNAEYSDLSADVVFNKYEFFMNKIENDMHNVMVCDGNVPIH